MHVQSQACCVAKTLFDFNADIMLDHLTVAPVSLSTVLLEWKVIPSDRYHCITSYNIQVSGPDGLQWKEHIPVGNQSFNFIGLQLIQLQEYTYCVTANLLRGQIHLKLTVNFTELQGGLKCHYDVISVYGSSYSCIELKEFKQN